MNARPHHRRRHTARGVTALRAGLVAALLVTASPALASATSGPAPTADAADAAGADASGHAGLAVLDHLDFLTTTVTPPEQAGHTTYRIEQEPAVGTLWTYADARDGGAFERVGGGPYDEASDTWGQGAFNADDVSRAAVVYLRHWRARGDDHSREQAYEMLRGLAYLQTDAGPDAGNVVLWMQPDGTLNPSPEPVELPDPSDSGASYWLARTTWALGEGYAAFAEDDPAFAAFLADRLDLALGAIERQSLVRYGTYDVADGVQVPAWLIVDGADASAEAAIGLAAFVGAAPPSPLVDRARTALRQLAEGVAAMSAGDARHYPYGAILPWTHSRSFWHAWASQMPVGLVAASAALDEPGLREAAVEDAATFTPYLMTATGAVNGWTPTPSDVTQIAYGTDARLQSLLAVADAQGSEGLADVAAMTAGWYFGANRAGTPMYERATGVTYDGLAPDGGVNRNSGAESTIHGLLSMLALEAHPDVAAKAATRTVLGAQDGVQVIEAEGATTDGGAVVAPEQAWTGESAWSGGAYLSLPAGAGARLTVPASGERRLVQPVVELDQGPGAGTADWRTGSYGLGTLSTGVGAQGVTEAPGALLPTVLRGAVGPRTTTLDVTVRAGAGQPVRLDAVMLRPAVSRLVLSGGGGTTVLLSSAAGQPTARRVDVPGSGRATVSTYDGRGALVARWSTGEVVAPVLDGGFTVVDRP